MKKARRSKVSSKQAKPLLKQPANLVILFLSVALLVVGLVGILHIHSLEAKVKTEMDDAKLAVFEEVAGFFIKENQITDGRKTMSEMTGYGISDEDGVFYITFDFFTYTVDDAHQIIADPLRHGIVYFWPDAERNAYGYAYSYHDDADYHPAGEYYRLDK